MPSNVTRRHLLGCLMASTAFLLAATHAPGVGGAVMKLDAEALAAGADLIVEGRVARIQSAKDGDYAHIAVSRAIKGKARGAVKVIFSKGMAESASFVEGEQVLLYLKSIGPGLYQTVGGAQGKQAAPSR